MNFTDPNVRARIVQHIQFALQAANSAFPDEDASSDNERQLIQQQLKVPIVLHVLSFTLNLDYVLKNAMNPVDRELSR